MADLNKESLKRQLVPGGTWGRNTKIARAYTAAAAAIADVIYMAFIPAGSRVDDLRLVNAALGASTTVKVGYINADGDDDDYWLGATATNTAGSSRTAAFSKHFDKDTYVIATVGGAAATGKIEVIVDYEYIGK
jgi:hypothetical protein